MALDRVAEPRAGVDGNASFTRRRGRGVAAAAAGDSTQFIADGATVKDDRR
jgi:hypothetical protein